MVKRKQNDTREDIEETRERTSAPQSFWVLLIAGCHFVSYPVAADLNNREDLEIKEGVSWSSRHMWALETLFPAVLWLLKTESDKISTLQQHFYVEVRIIRSTIVNSSDLWHNIIFISFLLFISPEWQPLGSSRRRPLVIDEFTKIVQLSLETFSRKQEFLFSGRLKFAPVFLFFTSLSISYLLRRTRAEGPLAIQWQKRVVINNGGGGGVKNF